MSNGDLIVEYDRLPDQFNASLCLPCLNRNHTEQMYCIKMVRLLPQNFPINLLRIRQLPLLMQHQPMIELGLQCRHIWPLSLRYGIVCFRDHAILNRV